MFSMVLAHSLHQSSGRNRNLERCDKKQGWFVPLQVGWTIWKRRTTILRDELQWSELYSSSFTSSHTHFDGRASTLPPTLRGTYSYPQNIVKTFPKDFHWLFVEIPSPSFFRARWNSVLHGNLMEIKPLESGPGLRSNRAGGRLDLFHHAPSKARCSLSRVPTSLRGRSDLVPPASSDRPLSDAGTLVRLQRAFDIWCMMKEIEPCPCSIRP
jgi:hypothetical protein